MTDYLIHFTSIFSLLAGLQSKQRGSDFPSPQKTPVLQEKCPKMLAEKHPLQPVLCLTWGFWGHAGNTWERGIQEASKRDDQAAISTGLSRYGGKPSETWAPESSSAFAASYSFHLLTSVVYVRTFLGWSWVFCF